MGVVPGGDVADQVNEIAARPALIHGGIARALDMVEMGE
ncbi:hypothetical protein IL54_0969 [Sphingobium sp. ba1]|nr:hypothetical protein IL54_0969 [Sphingobium sp. ba1]